MLYFTGFADEAGQNLETQIKVTKALGWRHIESRSLQIDGEKANIHDISEASFEKAVRMLHEGKISINCFGSAIANASKKITDPFEITLKEVHRALPRMQKLGAKLIRIMSYPQISGTTDQMEEERFHRLREIQKIFSDGGIQPVHENCHNYGSISWKHSLKLLENVPGLKLVYDTGNCLVEDDITQSKPHPKQSSWDFYKNVKDHIAYIHIKDGIFDPSLGKCKWTFAGEGQGDVHRILTDLLSGGYSGGISIEPHLTLKLSDSTTSPEEVRYNTYLKYGQIVEKMVTEIRNNTLICK
jgi:sugar phosphate isomerase/epimerase